MSEKEVKPIEEQIIEELFERLRKSEAYNEAIITKLKEAFSKGKLTSPKTIIDAISTQEE